MKKKAPQVKNYLYWETGDDNAAEIDMPIESRPGPSVSKIEANIKKLKDRIKSR